MAGEVVNGFDPEGGDEEIDYPYETVYLSVGDFKAWTIPWQHMPGTQVLEALTLPEPHRMKRIIEMLEIGVGPEKTSGLMLLDLRELEEVIGQWMRKSSELSEREEERG